MVANHAPPAEVLLWPDIRRRLGLGAPVDALALLQATLQASPDAIAAVSLQGELLHCNQRFATLWSLDARALERLRVQGLWAHCAAQLQPGSSFLPPGPELLQGLCAEMQLHDGRVLECHVSEHFVFDALTGVVLQWRDITERKKAEQLIWSQAHYDALTGLPNRAMLHDRLEQEMLRALHMGYKLAVMFIDLDKFKEINDTLGHDRGDILLVDAAQRIRGCVRSSDAVARLGGDEFVVLLSGLQDACLASELARNILEQLAQPFDLGGKQAVISGSIGVTLFPDDATEVEGLFKNADQAMYVSKAHGRNQCSYFTRELEVAALRRMVLVAELRSALSRGEFFLMYQPIVDVQSGRLFKAEALIRWQHPRLGLVSPAEFIPLAEETGLIVPIGDWVFLEAIRRVKQLRAQYDPNFQVSINKSAVQFSREKGNPGTWIDKLHHHGLPGNAVTMEITESLLVDPNSAVKSTLLRYRDAGIQVAIDDFGTGYSSLSYLKRFDIDFLKIDQSFIRNLAPDSTDMAISQAIIAMAHALGLQVVAEGVETEEQFALLKSAGCDFVQGYWLSRPLTAQALGELLQRGALAMR
jgi:diguanylate cyclase (GGDEF)-like protein